MLVAFENTWLLAASLGLTDLWSDASQCPASAQWLVHNTAKKTRSVPARSEYTQQMCRKFSAVWASSPVDLDHYVVIVK